MEAVTLIEDSMDKLQQYGEELAEICEKHFPDVKRRVPKFKRREMNSVEKLKNSSQKQVRVFSSDWEECLRCLDVSRAMCHEYFIEI